MGFSCIHSQFQQFFSFFLQSFIIIYSPLCYSRTNTQTLNLFQALHTFPKFIPMPIISLQANQTDYCTLNQPTQTSNPPSSLNPPLSHRFSQPFPQENQAAESHRSLVTNTHLVEVQTLSAAAQQPDPFQWLSQTAIYAVPAYGFHSASILSIAVCQVSATPAHSTTCPWSRSSYRPTWEAQHDGTRTTSRCTCLSTRFHWDSAAQIQYSKNI